MERLSLPAYQHCQDLVRSEHYVLHLLILAYSIVNYDISFIQCMYVYSHSLTAAVEGVEVTALNATAVTVSWSALVIPDFSIDHYTVLYSRVESQRRRRQDGAMSAQFPSTATSGMIAGLDSTATYQFQVFATVTVDGIPLEGEKGSQARVPDGEWYVRLTSRVYLHHSL